MILSGGDDFELLFTTEQNFAETANDLTDKSGVALTKIGEIKQSRTIRLIDRDGNEYTLHQKGFTHF
jgi:thiamine-monophosphate kinase